MAAGAAATHEMFYTPDAADPLGNMKVCTVLEAVCAFEQTDRPEEAGLRVTVRTEEEEGIVSAVGDHRKPAAATAEGVGEGGAVSRAAELAKLLQRSVPACERGDCARLVIPHVSVPQPDVEVVGAANVCRFLLQEWEFLRSGSGGEGESKGEEEAAAEGVAVVGAHASAAVDDWVEWDKAVLGELVKQVILGMSAAGTAAELNTALQKVEAVLAAGASVLCGKDVGFSLADLCVATSLAELPAERLQGFPATAAYVERWKVNPICVRGREHALRFVQMAQEPVGLVQAANRYMAAAVLSAYRDVVSEQEEELLHLDRCIKPEVGDFQSTAGMKLFKRLKQARHPTNPSSPHDVAQRIIDHLPPEAQTVFTDVHIARPAFLTCRMHPAFVSKEFVDLVRTGPQPPILDRKRKVLVDFSSPNIAKDMHVGHLRSTIIGDSICRILEYCGNEVLRVNHVGDWGTQFGMLISHMKDTVSVIEASTNVRDLTALYKQAKKRFDEDADFKLRSQQTVVDLQAGDPECRQYWEVLCDVSRQAFQEIYDILNVEIEEVGESYYNGMLPNIINMLEEAGLVVETDDGAKTVPCEGHEFPLFLVKRDGGYGYDSTDLAALHHRTQTLNCDWVVILTDAGQGPHFDMIFDAGKRMNWLNNRQKANHLGFGLVLGPDGKKFKTRSGDNVRLADLLTESKDRMLASLRQRHQEGKTPLAEDELEPAARKIGVSAVKFFDLRQNYRSDYRFDFDRMLDTRGATAVYLLYTYARVASILRKAEDAGINVEELRANIDDSFLTVEPQETALAFMLVQFKDAIVATISTLMTARLCDFVMDVATRFSEFVSRCKVLDNPRQNERLLLCLSTKEVLGKAFELIGMQTVDRI